MTEVFPHSKATLMHLARLLRMKMWVVTKSFMIRIVIMVLSPEIITAMHQGVKRFTPNQNSGGLYE